MGTGTPRIRGSDVVHHRHIAHHYEQRPVHIGMEVMIALALAMAASYATAAAAAAKATAAAQKPNSRGRITTATGQFRIRPSGLCHGARAVHGPVRPWTTRQTTQECEGARFSSSFALLLV